MVKIKLVIIVLLLVSIWSFFNFYSDKKLYFYFLNVGQGDAILIRTPDHKFMLVDGGPDDSVLSELNDVLPFWVKKLDMIILTHPDADHITGLVEVIKYYEIENVIFSPVNKDTNIYREFLQTIELKHIRNVELRHKDDFIFGCCIFVDILWPMEDQDLNTIKPINNISLSFKLIYKDFEVVLAGDNETASERLITIENDVNADLLKVSHHGSNTSSIPEFLDEVSPEIAVIQVAANNKFGHPTSETLRKFRERGVEIYRNDLHGRIIISSNGYSYKVDCEYSC